MSMLKTILIDRAEDVHGDEIETSSIIDTLRATGADRWTGRAAALAEIKRGPVVDDIEDLAEENDHTIAAYLILTRSETHPDIPTLSVCDVEIQ